MTNVRALTEGDALTITVDMADVVKELQERAERVRVQWEENEWYLGEARATVGRLDEQLDALRETFRRLEADYHEAAGQLREEVRQRDEANWYLGELRMAHEALRQQNRQLAEQLAHAKDDVEVERALRKAVEGELSAAQRHEERRGAVRTYRPGMVAEVRAEDGRLLFYGCPPNISLTGLAFTTAEPVGDAPGFVEITLHIPEVGRPIDAAGRLAWCETVDGHLMSGCELLDLLPDSRKSLTEVLAKAA